MPSEDKRIDPLPDEFKSIEEAAEFWDTHSITDYEEFLKPVDADVDILRLHQHSEAGLFKMVVTGQGVAQTAILHDDK